MKSLIPAYALLALFLFAVAANFAQSFDAPSWQRLFSAESIESWTFTLFYSLASAAVAVAIGVAIAVSVQRGSSLSLASFWLALPALTVGFFFVILLGPTGIAASIWYLLSSGGDFPRWTRDESGWAIVAAAAAKETAFVVLWVRASLDRLDDKLFLTARTLGARRGQVFREIVFPVVKRPMLVAGLVVFLYSLGSWELPYLLGPSRPQAISLIVLNSHFYGDESERTFSFVLLSALAIVSLGTAWLAFRLDRRRF